MKKTHFLLLLYFIINFVVVAFIWKYLPLWKSLLLILWVVASAAYGYMVAYYKSKEEK